MRRGPVCSVSFGPYFKSKVKRLVSSETTAKWNMDAGDEFPISDAYVSLVIPTVAKSDQDWNSTPASITTLGKMEVHQRDTSALITQLRVFSISCWIHREICPNKEFSTLFAHTGN